MKYETVRDSISQLKCFVSWDTANSPARLGSPRFLCGFPDAGHSRHTSFSRRLPMADGSRVHLDNIVEHDLDVTNNIADKEADKPKTC